jgi:hypothetical protein
VDVTGTATEDLEDYIAATQRQIEAVEQHNQQLNEGQAWWNFWQRNRDLIQVNSDQVDVLRDNLNRAQLELAQQNQAVNPLTVDQEALDALDQVTARLQEQIAVTGYSADEAERWKLAQAGVTQEQLRTVAAMQQQAAAATSAAELRDDTNALVDALSYTIDTAHLSADALQIADLRARGLSESWITLIEKLQQGAAAAQEAAAAQADLDQLTASLQEQIVTAGMSADELERWRLAQRGIGDAALQTVAALQEQRNEAQRVADVAGSIDQITQALTEQIATAGMSADQAELWRLAQAGATDEQLRQVAALQEQALAAKEATDAKRDLARADQDLTAAQRGSSEALERIQAYEALLAGANEPPAPPPAALPTPDVISPQAPPSIVMPTPDVIPPQAPPSIVMPTPDVIPPQAPPSIVMPTPDFVAPDQVDQFTGAPLPAAPPDLAADQLAFQGSITVSSPAVPQAAPRAPEAQQVSDTAQNDRLEALLSRIAAACERSAETEPLEMSIEEVRG